MLLPVDRPNADRLERRTLVPIKKTGKLRIIRNENEVNESFHMGYSEDL